jgi:hypothetical protein
LLVIDDFALEPMTRDESRDVYQLFVERTARAATIITSNRDTADWLALFDDGLLGQSAVDRFKNNAYDLELQALERKPMTMRDWITKLDDFLKISGRRLLDHAGTVSADAAKAKAEAEYARYHALEDVKPRAIDAEFEKVAKRLHRPRIARGKKGKKA